MKLCTPPEVWRERRAKGLTMREIAAAMCAKHGVTLDSLKARGGPTKIRDARQEFMYLAHIEGKYSSPQVGAFLGGRDHTTILYGAKKYVDRLNR